MPLMDGNLRIKEDIRTPYRTCSPAFHFDHIPAFIKPAGRTPSAGRRVKRHGKLRNVPVRTNHLYLDRIFFKRVLQYLPGTGQAFHRKLIRVTRQGHHHILFCLSGSDVSESGIFKSAHNIIDISGRKNRCLNDKKGKYQ